MSRALPRFRRFNPTLPLVGLAQGVVLYRIFGRLEGQLTVSTFMYLGPNNSPTQGQLTTLLAAISAGVFAPYIACLSGDWGTGVEEHLDVVHRNDIQGVVSTANAGAVGGRANGHLPTEVAAVISRYTVFKGQHGRGRVSLPGIATADVTASTITAAGLLTAMTALGTQLLAGRSDGTNVWTSCIGQRQTATPRTIQAAAVIVKYVNRPILGTIRRRKLGRGK